MHVSHSSPKPLHARIGVFGVGFHAYWPQFDGLLDELLRQVGDVLSRWSSRYGVEVVDFGMVDDAESAYALLPQLKAADLDLVFCDMLTYATSATFAAIVRGLGRADRPGGAAAAAGLGLRASLDVHATVQ